MPILSYMSSIDRILPVEHRTIDNDGPGRMDVILSQSGQKA